MITLVNIATGLYLDYWKALIQDADARLFPEEDLQIVVFTDRATEASACQSQLRRSSLDVVTIPPLGWPEATRQRYACISEHSERMTGDVVVYLDADMRIPAVVGPELTPESWRGGLAFVRHPGYFRSGSFARRFLLSPKRAAKDTMMRLTTEGGIGQWERDERSMAYVPRRLRRVYVCGGTWMGQRESLLGMTRILAERTQIDTAHDIDTRWDDESFLNWYAAHNHVTLLDPSYCYVEADPLLRGLTPRIIAVEKGTHRVRTQVD